MPNFSENFIISEKLNKIEKITVWFRNETSLLVLWQTSFPAGEFTHYRASIVPPDAQENVIFVQREYEPTAQAQAAFKSLLPGKKYNISVQTVHKNRVSLPSSASYRTVPLRPVNLAVDEESLTSDSFRISWEVPTGMSEFDGYQVSILNSLVSYYVPKTDEPVMWFDFNNDIFEPGKTYNVAVKTISGNVSSWPAVVNVTREK
ncbi:tyrosine-protein phosphatase 10D-like [Sitodiplosis mosellana]|uniref:tyrosine-protein phosphatase 10D-like n=1 Tax=Sitodiplosis mosellana TaxID=263140 RepID=UPI0024445A85|nr:tyrosine-protein phosphatase 10D-like [Sitodiplosis mosellana]